MRHVILYRDIGQHNSDEAEKQAARDAGFVVLENRTAILSGDLVVPRYSALPFFKELEEDIRIIGGDVINNYSQHRYIADLKEYVFDLKELTPETWTSCQDLPDNCSFILKGETNSRKDRWRTHMFASDKKVALGVYEKLLEDGLISTQEIYIRKFIPLITFTHDVAGVPISKEFRFFVAYGQVLSGGYYWSNYSEELAEYPKVSDVPNEFLQEVIKRINNKINFYVVDVAQTKDEQWIVIECNDGMMSGLSDNDPKILYSNLKRVINERSCL